MRSDHVDLLCGVNKMGNGADGPDPRVGLLFAKAELLPQDTVQLGQDKRRGEQVELPSADAGQDLIRLTPWKGEGRDQDVGVEDDPHEKGGLFTDRMDESIHILLRPNAESLSVQGRLSLELSPPLLFEVEAQGFPDQLTLGSGFFLGAPLSLSDKLGGQ